MTSNIPMTITFTASTNLTMMFTIRRVGKKEGWGKGGGLLGQRRRGGEASCSGPKKGGLLFRGQRRRGGGCFFGLNDNPPTPLPLSALSEIRSFYSMHGQRWV